MQGLIQSSAQYQYAFKSGFCLGAGIHYTYFTINEFRVPSKVYGGIHTPALYVTVGHEKFWTERFGTDFGVKIASITCTLLGCGLMPVLVRMHPRYSVSSAQIFDFGALIFKPTSRNLVKTSLK